MVCLSFTEISDELGSNFSVEGWLVVKYKSRI